MAYLRDLDQKCRVCGKRAFKQLINRYNEALGLYCKKCAEHALKRQKELEK